MTINLLSKRIKDIKRELTNLKTSHKRGVGNIKIFSQKVNVDVTGHESDFSYFYIVVNLNRNYAPSTFVNFYPIMDNDGLSSFSETIKMNYSDDGYSVRVLTIWSYEAGLSSFWIDSLSPIDSIDYYWQAI